MIGKKLLIGGAIVFAAIALGLYMAREGLINRFFQPTETSLEQGVTELNNQKDSAIIADDLQVPWEIAHLPGGGQLVTERPGTLRRIGQNMQTYEIEGVEQTSEGGLLGLALHPNFEENDLIYLYLTALSGEGLINRVESYKLQDDVLSDRRVIIDDIPGASNHDGGKIAFGPDGKLYIATGDAGNENSAQDENSLAGKILRLNDDGSVPDDNPFSNAVYSYGHRNPQGLAWDSDGKLWSTEHGPSGTQSGNDELNLIIKGGNYGWPVIKGMQTREGMITPVAESGSDETWAPAGLAYADGSLFFTGLRGQSLYEARIIDGDRVELKVHLRKSYGRLRAVSVGAEGRLFVSTSNRDGRGEPKPGDDKIISFDLSIFR